MIGRGWRWWQAWPGITVTLRLPPPERWERYWKISYLLVALLVMAILLTATRA